VSIRAAKAASVSQRVPGELGLAASRRRSVSDVNAKCNKGSFSYVLS
jgi:hypothetical protein